MRFGRADALAYAPESNDDDIHDNRDDPKKRDNRPGIKNPWDPLMTLIVQIPAHTLAGICTMRVIKNPWDPLMTLIVQIPASVCAADPQRGRGSVGARGPGDSRDGAADD